MIPYTSGTGNVPTLNTLIEIAGASGKLMCVYSTDMTAVPKVAGEAMPASGWIQVKQWNDVEYSAGVLTGISATCSGASKVGIIEVLSDAVTHQAMHLVINGAWFELGMTDGTLAQTFQIPTHGTNTWLHSVYVETGVGTGAYEPYCNALGGANTDIGTEPERGKVSWITNTTGAVRFGSLDGTTQSGYLPTAGRKVVIQNVMCYSCTTTLRRTVSLGAVRPTFLYQGNGKTFFDKCSMSWNINNDSMSILYGLQFKNVAFSYNPTMYRASPYAQCLVENCSLGRGILYYSGNLITYKDCVFFSTTTGATQPNGAENFEFINCTWHNTAIQATSAELASGLTLNISNNILIQDCTFINCRLYSDSSSNVDIINMGYIDSPFGSSVNGTYAFYKREAIKLVGLTSDVNIVGFRLPLANNSPRGCLVNVNGTKTNNIDIRDIGTFDVPLDFTSPYPTDMLVYHFSTGKSSSISIRNCYTTGLALGLSINTSAQYYGMYINTGDSYNKVQFLNTSHSNSVERGGRASCTELTGVGSSVDGVLVADYFDSTTSGFIALFSSRQGESQDKITLFGGATWVDGIAIAQAQSVGMGAEIETGDYILGHTSFKNANVEMYQSYNTNASRHNYQYAIDLNNGNGYSAMSGSYAYNALGAVISTHAIDSAKGFKLKLRITTHTNSAFANIARIVLRTNSTVDAQKIKYPNPVLVPTITIDADTAFLAGGTGKFAMYLDDMVGYEYGVNTTPVMDSYSNPIQGTITTAQTTFTFGYSMNMQGIRQKNEDTNVVVVATNPLYTQPIVIRGTITSTGLFVALTKSDDKAMIGGL